MSRTEAVTTAIVSGGMLTALSCPRCGGAPDPEGGTGHLARCGSCGVLGRIDEPSGNACRLAVEPAIDRAFALDALRRELARRGQAGAVRLHADELLFAPYWRVSSLLVGRLEGRRERPSRTLERVTLEGGQSVYRFRDGEAEIEHVQREIEKRHLAVISGCPLEELGLPTLDRQRQSPGPLGVARPLDRLGRIGVFDLRLRSRGTVLDPLVSRARAEHDASELVERHRRGMISGLLPGATISTAVIARESVLLFYPLYVLRFQYAARRGLAVVDATSGRIVAIRQPEPEASPA
ncbi:MAG: hypothetical protein JSV80_01935, partial [Acidobacteriota bacterium]